MPRNQVTNIKLIILTVFLLIFLCSVNRVIARTNAADQSKSHSQTIKTYPDEYSALDDSLSKNPAGDDVFSKTIEKARQKYDQALSLIAKGDTIKAAAYFEDAIEVLNRLVIYPNINRNEAFTNLAQSIIEDYENFIQSIDNLSENSSLFMIRERLLQEVETINTKRPQQNLQTKKDTTAKAGIFVQKPNSINVIPLVDNEFVQKNLSFLSQDKNGRKFIELCLQLSTRWFPMMKRIAAEEGMPEEIIYLSMFESALNPNAVSRAEAVGLWQFMRSTGELYSLNNPRSVWVDERRDPEKSTRAAMRHLKDLFNQLGDWHLALAAYNCGINGVVRSMNKSEKESPNFWDIREFLPRETRNYVPRYIATAKIAMQPEAYGFNLKEIQFADEFKYDTFIVKEPVNLQALAKCSGLSYQDFAFYNPELIRNCTPPDIKEYKLRIPYGTLAGFTATYATLTPEEKQPWITHKVERGETLASIAQTYGLTKEDLIEANDIKIYKNKVAHGTVLRIPVEKQDAQPLVAGIIQKPASEPIATAQPASDNKPVSHVVKKGETLFSISRQYGVQVNDIRKLNNISEENYLELGRTIQIPPATNKVDNLLALNKKVSTEPTNTVPTDVPAATPQQSRIVEHKVRRNETLAQIADDYEVSIESIRKLNKLKDRSLREGEILKIETFSTNPESKGSKPLTSNANKVTHKVKKGETLSIIAAKYGVSEDDIKQWNAGTIKGNTVFSGNKLKIYTEKASKGSSAAASPKTKKLPKTYTVRKGETLSAISRKYGVSIAELKKKNKQLKENKLKPGQKIRIQ